MICQKCKAQNLDDAKFCESCGAKLEPPKPAGSFCTSCGKQLKPGARFCGSCGAAQDGSSAPVPTPASPKAPRPAQAPAPALMPAPAPAPMPAPMPSQAPVANPLYHGGPQQSAGSYGPVQGVKRKSACSTTCIVLLVIVAALGFGGYYFGKRFILSRPEVLVGKWKSEGSTDKKSEVFTFELVADGGVKLAKVDDQTIPIAIVFKPFGNQEFKAEIKNPNDPNQKVDVSIKTKSFSEIEISGQFPGGEIDHDIAKRIAGP